MYTIVAIALQLIYAIGVLGLAIYGVHALWLTVRVRRMLSAAATDAATRIGRK